MVIGDCIGSMWRLRPTEDPIGFLGTHVDAAAAHRNAEIIMPVGAMEGMSLAGEKGGPGHTGQLVSFDIRSLRQVAAAHVFGWHFNGNIEFPCWGARGNAVRPRGVIDAAGGDQGCENWLIVFETDQLLGLERDLDAFLFEGDFRCN